MFVFSFESHGRCETPQRFVLKEELRNFKSVWFYKNDSDGTFVCVGGFYGSFSFGNEKSNTFCVNLSCAFVGIENNTLAGKPNNGRFTCTRIVAVHLQ